MLCSLEVNDPVPPSKCETFYWVPANKTNWRKKIRVVGLFIIM